METSAKEPLKVLIIDDEEGLGEMLRYGLKKSGYAVTISSDGETALGRARQEPFDLAVCDIMMPGMSGIEVLPLLKQILPEIEVVMATGNATLETAIEAMKRGAFDYITKPYSLGHLTAILEKAQVHRSLKAKVGHLEEVNRIKSEFMATMSHELRTPMASILGYASLVLRGVYGEVPSKQETVMHRIEANANNLLQLINNILDLSKLSAKRMDLFVESFHLNEVIKEVHEALEPLAGAKGLFLKAEASEPVWVQTDRTKLKQVLINLIGNAIKFTKTGGVTVIVCGSSDPKHVELGIQDTGIGITAENIPRLFQEFQQLDSSTTREYGGTGLGLSISKKMVELMQGTIQVESALGQGTLFRLDLPIRMEGPAQNKAATTASNEIPARTDEKLILSIDDNPDVLKVLAASFQNTGYQFAGALSGEEGLALARQRKPDAITLDIMLPHMDGWSILQVLKNDPVLRTIPVYIVSIVDNKALAFSLGVAGYLMKPFTREDLLKKLDISVKGRMQEVLVVDANPSVRDLVSETLNKDGYFIRGASSGEEALAQMKQMRPDILLLGLVLPGMTGFDVLEAMDQFPGRSSTSVFVIAENEPTEKERAFLERRVHAILEKRSDGLDAMLVQISRKLDALRQAA
jgi:signal transduction histidine kinase